MPLMPPFIPFGICVQSCSMKETQFSQGVFLRLSVASGVTNYGIFRVSHQLVILVVPPSTPLRIILSYLSTPQLPPPLLYSVTHVFRQRDSVLRRLYPIPALIYHPASSPDIDLTWQRLITLRYTKWRACIQNMCSLGMGISL